MLINIKDGKNTGGGAPLDSPAFTGTPTAPTAAVGTNTTQIATTAFVKTAVSGVTWDSLPSKPSTFTPSAHAQTHAAGGTDEITPSSIGAAEEEHTHETADVEGLDAALAAKAPSESPALTGVPTAPTAEAGTDSEQIATTAFVAAALADAEPFALEATLTAADWTGDAAPFAQSLEVPGVTAETVGTVGIADTATDEQYQAAVKAQLRKSEQTDGTLTFKAYGTLPTVDIPIIISTWGVGSGNGEGNCVEYSLDEQVIGTWIDGKPIYRKIFINITISARLNGTLIDLQDLCVDSMIDIYGHGFPGSYPGRTIPYREVDLGFDKANNALYTYNTNSLVFAADHIILEYTKTTDEATIAIANAEELDEAYTEGVQSA